MNKYGRNFKPGIPLSKDFRNKVIQMSATRPISEICERYRMNRSTVCTKLGHVFTCTCPRLDENDGIIKINVFGYEKTTTTKKNSLSPFMSVKKNLKTV